jgi:hypothetical protein
MVVHGLGRLRRLAAGTAFASALSIGAGAALAADGPAAAPAGAPPAAEGPTPAVGAPARPGFPVPVATDPPPAAPSALREAVEGVLGTEVHGRFTVKWESRVLKGEGGENDHDLYSVLDLRVGDETRDTWSATVFARSDWDLDQPNNESDPAFASLSDTYHDELSALLYTAYGTWRPASGRIESVRFGRQYIDVAETFHVDGAAVQTTPMWDQRKLRVRAYGGVPVHFYEADSEGDWIAGLQATAEPWKGGRAAVDAAHVDDKAAGYGEERNDLLAAQVWHALSENVDLNGRFTWLDQARDAKVRTTVRVPDQDLVVQASVFRLLQDEEQLATEYDPYYEVLRTLHPYYLGDLRVVKGFDENVSVEVGVSTRQLADQDDEGEYNRETTRYWVMPTFDDLLWKDSSVAVGAEVWDGQDEKIRTWSFDFTQRFGRDAKISLGTDFQAYDYGELLLGEREDVRTVYTRLHMKVSDAASLDVRYSWERDEEDSYHVVSLALAFDF